MLALVGHTGCIADYTLGRELGEQIFNAPGGTIEIVRMQVRLADLRATGELPDLDLNVDLDEPGPWLVEPLNPDSSMGPGPLNFAAGDWTQIELSIGAVPNEPIHAIELEGRFRPDDGGPTLDFVWIVDDTLSLGAVRNGTTRYDNDFSVDLVDNMHPGRWFPVINVGALQAQGNAPVMLSATTNAVIYGQLVDAFDREARDWLDPN